MPELCLLMNLGLYFFREVTREVTETVSMKYSFLSVLFFGLLVVLVAPVSAQTPIPPGASYEVGFSPGGTSLRVVEKFINEAHRELLMAVYELTSYPIAKALIQAEQRGVRVEIVADAKAARQHFSKVRFLAHHGIPVRVNDRYAILHHKFMVADGKSLETGSFNYSEAAVKHNAENALVLWNIPSLANRYRTEWLRLWNEAHPVR